MYNDSLLVWDEDIQLMEDTMIFIPILSDISDQGSSHRDHLPHGAMLGIYVHATV